MDPDLRNLLGASLLPMRRAGAARRAALVPLLLLLGAASAAEPATPSAPATTGRAALSAPSPAACPVAPWPLWSRYVERFVSADGRVVDRTGQDRTTSEGQAYALFFALVANDRSLFDRLLRWTDDNLAEARLGERLPAWKWGRGADGAWRVLDRNSASDADLWAAYALLEAGRLWSDPRYDALARRLLATAAAREVADLPGLGPMLLPGPVGFELPRGRGWRLNPSYLAPQLLRRFSGAGAPGPWDAVLPRAVRVLSTAAPRGAVADWVAWSPRRGFETDPISGPVGSYDAIRASLWAGLLAPDDPARPALVAATSALVEALRRTGEIPERIDVRTLRGRGVAPVGFYAALLPLARASGDADAARRIEERLAARRRREDALGEMPAYYDQNLTLFAQGFVEGRYRFDAGGRLATAWEPPCAGSARRGDPP